MGNTEENWLAGPSIAVGNIAGESALAPARTLWERVFLEDHDSMKVLLGSFADAGADIIVACTDRLNPVTLASIEACENPDRDVRLNSEIVTEIRSLMGDRISIIGAIGPVEPIIALDEISIEDLSAAYESQVGALSDAGVTGFVCRSFTELEAIVVAVEAIRRVSERPIIASMCFDAGADSLETVLGVTVPEMVRAVTEAGASCVGVDRTEFPDGIPAVITLLKESCDLPIYAEVNAGMAELVENRRVFPESPDHFGERYARLADAGASIFGGGLGAAPAHIAAFSKARATRERQSRLHK